MSGRNSAVECHLAKVDVDGSNPFARSIFLRRHSQVVRQRSAKPLYSGSNPDAASILRENLACVFTRLFIFLRPHSIPDYVDFQESLQVVPLSPVSRSRNPSVPFNRSQGEASALQGSERIRGLRISGTAAGRTGKSGSHSSRRDNAV